MQGRRRALCGQGRLLILSLLSFLPRARRTLVAHLQTSGTAPPGLAPTAGSPPPHLPKQQQRALRPLVAPRWKRPRGSLHLAPQSRRGQARGLGGSPGGMEAERKVCGTRASGVSGMAPAPRAVARDSSAALRLDVLRCGQGFSGMREDRRKSLRGTWSGCCVAFPHGDLRDVLATRALNLQPQP